MQPELRSFSSVSTAAPVTMLMRKPGSPAGRAARLQLPGMPRRVVQVTHSPLSRPRPGHMPTLLCTKRPWNGTCTVKEEVMKLLWGIKLSPQSQYGSCHWNFDEHTDSKGQRLGCTEDEAIVWISSPTRPPPLVFLSHHQPLILVSVVDALSVNSVVSFFSTLLLLLDLPAGRAFILFLAS